MSSPAERLLDPAVLARVSNLPLVAKTVVQGFLMGLHRSPYQGVSTDFAEYRPYSAGDDPRGIDWNVYARTDRHYIKKYHGDTNVQLHIVLDSSASMAFKSSATKTSRVTKFEYGCFLAASLAYFATQQRDAAGLILFDTAITESIPARSRGGQLMRILHTLDKARPGKQTDFAKPLNQVGHFLHRRGIVAIISDFYDDPEQIVKHVRELAFQGNDVVLFHVLDPDEIDLKLEESSVLEDLETGERIEVVPEYAGSQYRQLIRDHIEKLQYDCRAAHIDYALMDTSRPLDFALFTYLSARKRRK
jgi:uncharacterized protein (DUF58 family)